jgi:hypothetical protein
MYPPWKNLGQQSQCETEISKGFYLMKKIMTLLCLLTISTAAQATSILCKSQNGGGVSITPSKDTAKYDIKATVLTQNSSTSSSYFPLPCKISAADSALRSVHCMDPKEAREPIQNSYILSKASNGLFELQFRITMTGNPPVIQVIASNLTCELGN